MYKLEFLQLDAKAYKNDYIYMGLCSKITLVSMFLNDYSYNSLPTNLITKT